MAFRWGERNCSQQPFQTTTRGLFSITKFDALRFSAQLRLTRSGHSANAVHAESGCRIRPPRGVVAASGRYVQAYDAVSCTYLAANVRLFAASSMRCATACGCDTYTAWLPLISTTLAPVRLDMARCASGGIILSLVATRYQLGLDRHAGSVTAPFNASRPQGTCASAMNAAPSGATSAAKAAANFALSRNRKPSCGGMIGGTGA